MKKEKVKILAMLIIILAYQSIITSSFSQSPNKMSYQAVVRNSSGVLVQSSNVGIKISLLQGTTSGTVVYSETHNVATNNNGLATLEIGGGSVITGTFANIDWSAGPYFLKTETDPTGGTNYTITGTSQLLSVPYALYAARSGTPGPQGLPGADGKSIVWRGEWDKNESYDVNDAVTFNGSSYIAIDKITNEDPTTKYWNLMAQKGDQGIQGLTGATGGYPVHAIGEAYGGGIVFYVYDNGQHGLIAATADQSTGIRWYAGIYTNTMAFADGIGAGKANTAIIIANQGNGDGSIYAARICNEYSVTAGGVTYSDWYLPSKFELNLLYLQRNLVGGFANNYYWSSTEDNANYAWIQFFTNGGQYGNSKLYSDYVRAIRSF